MQDVVQALEFRDAHGPLPEGLRLAPGRIRVSDDLQAVGLIDGHARTVGVDVAVWRVPCAVEIDDIVWRRVYTWSVASDRDLERVSVITPPGRSGETVTGSYGYTTDGVPGFGVLSLTVLENGSWRICDCWGHADEALRVKEISTQLGTA